MPTTSLIHFNLHNSIWNGKVNARFSRIYCKARDATIILMHFSLHNSIWNGKVNARFFRVYCKTRDVNQKFDAFQSA
jgi:hypothetical protein